MPDLGVGLLAAIAVIACLGCLALVALWLDRSDRGQQIHPPPSDLIVSSAREAFWHAENTIKEAADREQDTIEAAKADALAAAALARSRRGKR